MLKFRLNTAVWTFTLECLLVLLVVERFRHENEIKSLKSDIRILNEKLSTKSNYADLDIYLSANATGRIDDTVIYNYMRNTKSKMTAD